MPVFDAPFIVLLAIGIGTYLIGTIPFGQLIAGAESATDHDIPRPETKRASLLAVLLDVSKGFLVVVAARQIAGEDAAQLAGFAVFIGHLFPLWSRFKGGKGMATALGVLVGVAPIVGLIALFAWLFVYFVYRYASLAALVSSAITPPVAIILGFGHMALLMIVMTTLVWCRHWGSIARLADGSEKIVDWRRK